MNRRLFDILRVAPGWLVTRTNQGHYRLTHPEVSGALFIGATPSDFRPIRNVASAVKRARRHGTASRYCGGRHAAG